ncbi:hypothetical protein AUEXF2481DRAFT_498927 [Aureobasidium subglaciale EXF-2481]|uniref:Zn(2)-C6 fungal-type domain-containing protein n=1 Tax=Aureobasidium subglaciale (strain EXF-2481) TaxID=1043005 RepID=A0A074YWT5_AURSE|nr:uncharacterized protein AUEXF2481DRAFT_498927 [Aureobasidium subglaciale EXF-2481]KEQ91341.1 hypothetical protein AUEXF2481DRAFT_498927 [Aureobasidium subglaciale EXF-2481]
MQSPINSPTTRVSEVIPRNVLSRRACLECHRQKQKCNKQQPCSNCLRRGIPHHCVWPTDPRRHRVAGLSSPLQQRPTTSRIPDFELSTQVPRIRGSGSTNASSHDPDETPQPGRLYRIRDAPSYYGHSYFGPHSAAALIGDSSSALSDGISVGYSHRTRLGGSTQPFRSERGPYAQLWELLGSLPRRKAVVDRLVQLFLGELNVTLDAVHKETFMRHYEEFWDRKAGCDDLTNLNLRWLSVLFIILAFGELLACPQPCSVEAQRECEDSSLHFYWSARKSLVVAPSFYGESPDLTRAGILITRYLIYTKRISESWLTGSFAVRMAQAQGMHIDGDHLHLPKKVVETRRRLWGQLYFLDVSIALALGRPNSINEKHCVFGEMDNIWVDDLSNEEATLAEPLDLETSPTPSALLIFQHRLTRIIVKIYDMQFCAASTANPSTSYDEVLRLDDLLQLWKEDLPSYFAFSPDTRMDNQHAYLAWHRGYLHSAFHFARITLHRAFLFRPSITNRFQRSREACISSGCADLQNKLSLHNPSMAERIKAHVGAHQLSNSALILGIIAVQSPHARQTEGILNDLQSYCYQQHHDPWSNEFGLAEARVVELCIARTQQARRSGTSTTLHSRPLTSLSSDDVGRIPSVSQGHEAVPYPMSTHSGESRDYLGPGRTEPWSFNEFPELMDFGYWEGLIDNLSEYSAAYNT